MERQKKKQAKNISINARSKVISKGGAYGDRLEARRAGGQAGKTSGGAALNKLGQKHSKLNLGRIPGLALTKKQKKQKLKQLAKEAAREEIKEEDDSLSEEKEEEPVQNEKIQ